MARSFCDWLAVSQLRTRCASLSEKNGKSAKLACRFLHSVRYPSLTNSNAFHFLILVQEGS